MHRLIEADLLAWKEQPGRKPLLLRGARQVGKSTIVEKFGSAHFASLVVVNFEFERKYQTAFNSLDPVKIIATIAITSGQDIKPGETLLFLDEIQECPEAILALRYFKEKMPELHVIAAGSLLEFTLNNPDFRLPVGRIQSLYMKPCSFAEFLNALGQNQLNDYLTTITPEMQIELAIHETLLEYLRAYFFIGGMPEVVAHYAQHKNLYQCQLQQASLLEYYQKDFGKYDSRINIRVLQNLFDKIPGLVTQQFKYVNIDPDKQSRELKPALQALIDAGLVYPIYHTSASGLPLQTSMNERKFKVLFLDIGLVGHATQLDIQTMMKNHLILLNRGVLAEQFVGQELLVQSASYQAGQLYYWAREKRGSSAEVDYVINIGPQILPVEVKAGKRGWLKSLQLFLDEKGLPFGIRISQHQFTFKDRILSVPLYMIAELPRLVRELIE